jgi:molybdopterin-containing oxidoreductase family membrane subunit
VEPEILLGRPTDAALSEQLLSPAWTRATPRWWAALAVAGAFFVLMVVAMSATIGVGIGLWGNNIPVAWAFAIINFVWWIGIGHAGTFISAILLLLEQKWRTSINRFSEAMTLFAVIQAGLYPILHLGRPWFFYWLFPYPATMRVWPQFRSALPWDAAAVSTYFTVSLLFWYLGLLPDFAALRDRAPKRRQRIAYGILSLGFRGSVRHYRHYRLLYGLLAGLATPLVLSVHSIVSSDFAIALVPGWHSTIFPPFFVAGAIFSGFGLVVTLLVPARHFWKLHNVITAKHLDALGKMLLATGWIVVYAYIIEDFVAWYTGSPAERYQYFVGRPFGPNAAVFWLNQICNIGVLQLLWSKRIRTSPVALWIVSIFVNIGMWTERFVIVVQSLQREYLPSQWHAYAPTYVDWSIFAGTGGFFMCLFLLFLRFFPFIPVAEVKELNHELQKGEH